MKTEKINIKKKLSLVLLNHTFVTHTQVLSSYKIQCKFLWIEFNSNSTFQIRQIRRNKKRIYTIDNIILCIEEKISCRRGPLWRFLFFFLYFFNVVHFVLYQNFRRYFSVVNTKNFSIVVFVLFFLLSF